MVTDNEVLEFFRGELSLAVTLSKVVYQRTHQTSVKTAYCAYVRRISQSRSLVI